MKKSTAATVSSVATTAVVVGAVAGAGYLLFKALNKNKDGEGVGVAGGQDPKVTDAATGDVYNIYVTGGSSGTPNPITPLSDTTAKALNAATATNYDVMGTGSSSLTSPTISADQYSSLVNSYKSQNLAIAQTPQQSNVFQTYSVSPVTGELLFFNSNTGSVVKAGSDPAAEAFLTATPISKLPTNAGMSIDPALAAVNKASSTGQSVTPPMTAAEKTQTSISNTINTAMGGAFSGLVDYQAPSQQTKSTSSSGGYSATVAPQTNVISTTPSQSVAPKPAATTPSTSPYTATVSSTSKVTTSTVPQTSSVVSTATSAAKAVQTSVQTSISSAASTASKAASTATTAVSSAAKAATSTVASTATKAATTVTSTAKSAVSSAAKAITSFWKR